MYDPNHFKHLFTLGRCFQKAYKENYPFRTVELETIAKFLSCKTERLGKLTYSCSNHACTHVKYILSTCKTKLCPSCGQKATEQWIATQKEILPDCKFRHITFTMPGQFWPIFQANRWLLNELFACAADTLLTQAEIKKLTIGIFVALHTYGRKLNFNCHIHLALAEYGIDNHENLKKFSFKFASLMKQWRYGIIKLLRENYDRLICPSELSHEAKTFQSWNDFLNTQYNRHWNVNIAKKTSHKAHTAKYLGSYIKKPPIAASRLKEYANGEVTFSYLDHNDKTHKSLTLSQTEMMLRILNHVPEKYFKMIRYYGFLSTRLRGDMLPKLYEKLGQKVNKPKSFGFASMMKAFMKVDPFECILCGSRMVFTGFIRGMRIGQLVASLEKLALLRPI